MSVQLSLYPQNFNGVYSNISVQPNNLLNDSINWTGIDAASTSAYIDTPPFLPQLFLPLGAIANFNGSFNMAVNQWFAFGESSTNVKTDFGIPTNFCKFEPPTNEVAGILQRITLLSGGASYTLSLTNAFADGSDGGSLVLAIWDASTNTILTSSNNTLAGNTSNDLDIAFTVPPSGVDCIIGIWWQGASGSATNHLLIDDAAVNLTTDFISGAIDILESGQVIVDLYDEESIPLTFSVDNFKNAAEKTQSYSKAFKLPGTRRNNLIFDNLFEITRSTLKTIQFNPHIKTQASLKENGFLIFEGYLKVIDVQEKEGEISYNVNLYSTPITLADVLKTRVIADLDLEELAHDYNRTQIQYSWNDGVTSGQTTPITWLNANTSGFRTDFNTVKYPFCDWNHKFLVATGASSPTANMPQLNCLQDAFRPWLNIKYLIDRIFQDSPFEYQCAVWESTDFGNLYMDFNWGADVDIPTFNESGYAQNDFFCRTIQNDMPLSASFTKTPPNDYSPGCATKTNSQPSILGHAFGGSGASGFSEWTATYDGQVYSFLFTFVTQSTTFTLSPLTVTYNNHIVQYQWMHESGGTATPIPGFFFQTPNVGSPAYTGFFSTILAGINVLAGDKFYCEAKYVSSAAGTVCWAYTNVQVYSAINKTVDSSLLGTMRGELAQWDFIKGLMTMYNLLAIPDEDNPNIITFKTYDELYADESNGTSLKDRKILHDWTDKIDTTQIKLTPLEIKDKTILQYEEESDDYMFNNYKQSVEGHLYGSKIYSSGYNNVSLLTGENKIEAKPFAATIMKPLMTQYHTFIVPTMYSMGDDGKTDGFENAPRICYNNGLYDMTSDGYSYYIPVQNGVTSSNQEKYLRFSHLSELPIDFTNNDTRDVNFGECQLVVDPAFATPVSDNLYNLYWARYLHELYHPDTREMTLKCNLSPADIEMFKFNHQIYIKNRRFRVNKIDYKPNDLSTVEFILIPE